MHIGNFLLYGICNFYSEFLTNYDIWYKVKQLFILLEMFQQSEIAINLFMLCSLSS